MQKPIKVSMHNHSTFSDGTDTLEDMLEYAYGAGLTHYTISDHSYNTIDNDWNNMTPELYERYLKEASAMKKRYEGRMDVFISMEMEYITSLGISTCYADDLLPKLDYVIGGVHDIGKDGRFMAVDYTRDLFTDGIRDIFDGNVKSAVECYYETYVEMIKTLKPQQGAHFDLIKKNDLNSELFNRESQWYTDLVFDCIDVISTTDTVMEVNTGGVARYSDKCFYSDEKIIKRFREKGIAVTIAADAHSKSMIDSFYGMAVERLKVGGYDEIAVPSHDGWKLLGL